ncbi:hypothetical protein DFJ77DRAFT_37033 [Powellomyces hirtus]|nr:hypothetical protein DFJ77DRAFT_37033 [Powellomyces hirtus]
MLNEQVKTVLQLEIPLDPSKPLVKEKINFLWWSAQFPKSSTWKTIYSTYLYMDMSPELAKALSLTANTVQVKLFHITRYNATCAGGIIAKMTTLFNSISFAGRHNWTTVDVWDGLLDLCNSSTLKKSITLSWLKPAEWSSDDETGQLPSREIEEHLPALAVTHPAYGLLRDAAPYVGAKCMRDLMHGSQSWCTSVQTTIPAIISRCERAGYLSQKQRDVLQRVGKYQWEQGTFQKTPYFDDWLLRFTVREDQMQGEFRLQDRMTFRLECLDDGSESDFPGQDIPRVLIAFTCQYDESQKSEPLDMLDAATLRGVCTELGLMHYWNPDGPVISRNDGLLFALLACAFPADAPIEWAWSLCRKMLDKQRAWMTA